jgi:hypothetical protein
MEENKVNSQVGTMWFDISKKKSFFKK